MDGPTHITFFIVDGVELNRFAVGKNELPFAP